MSCAVSWPEAAQHLKHNCMSRFPSHPKLWPVGWKTPLVLLGLGLAGSLSRLCQKPGLNHVLHYVDTCVLDLK